MHMYAGCLLLMARLPYPTLLYPADGRMRTCAGMVRLAAARCAACYCPPPCPPRLPCLKLSRRDSPPASFCLKQLQGVPLIGIKAHCHRNFCLGRGPNAPPACCLRIDALSPLAPWQTHTMEGPEGDRGVAFLTLADLFRIAAMRRVETEYEITVSMLEVRQCIRVKHIHMM